MVGGVCSGRGTWWVGYVVGVVHGGWVCSGRGTWWVGYVVGVIHRGWGYIVG